MIEVHQPSLYIFEISSTWELKTFLNPNNDFKYYEAAMISDEESLGLRTRRKSCQRMSYFNDAFRLGTPSFRNYFRQKLSLPRTFIVAGVPWWDSLNQNRWNLVLFLCEFSLNIDGDGIVRLAAVFVHPEMVAWWRSQPHKAKRLTGQGVPTFPSTLSQLRGSTLSYLLCVCQAANGRTVDRQTLCYHLCCKTVSQFFQRSGPLEIVGHQLEVILPD